MADTGTIVTVVEFLGAGVSEEHTIQSVEGLQQHLKEVDLESKSRMYLVEDPSHEVMHVLGEHFHVDPLFFISHKYTPNFENPHEYKVLRQLPSQRKGVTWYTLHYREALSLPRDAPLTGTKHMVTCGKVHREISTYTYSNPTKTKGDIVTALVRRNASFWYSKSKDCDTWNGK
jgi:hypothetical protein